jgi:hypothetical protein
MNIQYKQCTSSAEVHGFEPLHFSWHWTINVRLHLDACAHTDIQAMITTGCVHPTLGRLQLQLTKFVKCTAPGPRPLDFLPTPAPLQ